MPKHKAIEIRFQDQARIGRKNGQTRVWAGKGTGPRLPADQRYKSAYPFGAICPARGTGAALALPSRSPEFNPVKNIWQYLRSNWISNSVFHDDDAIIDTACNAWTRLMAQPRTITSIGMRKGAHVGQSK